MSLNIAIRSPAIFLESSKNKLYRAEEETSLRNKIRSSIKYTVVDKALDRLYVCIQNPRNEIDNPIHYCTQQFYFTASALTASSAVGNLDKTFQTSSASLWNIFMKSTGRLMNEIQEKFNIPTGGWQWYCYGEIPMAEYYALACINGSISPESAIQLSGLDEMDFAQMVQEKAIERDLPVFRAYLRGEKVEDRLPFSEEKSLEFKDLMAKEIE